MSGRFFLDSSALVKLYHKEPGTDRVEQLFAAADSVLIISELASVELHSALARKARTGEITPEAQEEVAQNFDHDCATRFEVEPLNSAVVLQAKNLVQKHGRELALRTLDALQLASAVLARSQGDLVFVSADTNLNGVAEAEGLTTLNPEAPEVPSEG